MLQFTIYWPCESFEESTLSIGFYESSYSQHETDNTLEAFELWYISFEDDKKKIYWMCCFKKKNLKNIFSLFFTQKLMNFALSPSEEFYRHKFWMQSFIRRKIIQIPSFRWPLPNMKMIQRSWSQSCRLSWSYSQLLGTKQIRKEYDFVFFKLVNSRDIHQ